MADPLSFTGTAVGIVSLVLSVWNGLLQYYSAWKDFDNDVLDIYNRLEDLSKTFKLLGSVIKNWPV